MELGLRHQGVLVSAVRGCDTVSRDASIKLMARCLRAAILNTHVADPKKAKTFIEHVDADTLLKRMNDVVRDHDSLPHHYIMHLIHAAEIVAYYAPHDSLYWFGFYSSMCNKLHMTAETKAELDHRLNADEDTFYSKQ